MNPLRGLLHGRSPGAQSPGAAARACVRSHTQLTLLHPDLLTRSILSVSLRVKGAIALQRFHPFSLLTSHFCDPDTPVKVQVSRRPPQSDLPSHTQACTCVVCVLSLNTSSPSLCLSLSHRSYFQQLSAGLLHPCVSLVPTGHPLPF